ncbi:MAG: sulfite exporter TauE/SafE family protein [Bacteroidota bacterium]
MDLPGILLLLAAGGAAGFLAGFFGVGGGILLVPVLLFYFASAGVSPDVATHMALGTSLLIVIFASLSSAVRYTQNGYVVWRAVGFIGAASVAGAWAGSRAAGMLEGDTLRQIFAGVVLLASGRLLVEREGAPREEKPNPHAGGLVATGLATGAVSSLAGVGGGVFSIPIMYHFLGFPLKKALGTSSATIVLTAMAAGAGYVLNGWGNPLLPPRTLGYVDWLSALPVIAGTLPAARYGATVAHRTKSDILRKIYAVFLLVIAFRMFFF